LTHRATAGSLRGEARNMRAAPVQLLLASLMTACGGSTVTATQCRDPVKCNEQTSLCHNSCDHKGAGRGCRDCCNEMRLKCIDCAPEKEIRFGVCRKSLEPRN
jgi:hypothetical protein